MKDKLIGTYVLGGENIRLYLIDGASCFYNLQPDDKGCGRIRIGYDNTWHRLIGNLTHEAIECSMRRLDCAYFHQNDKSDDNGNRFFAMDHRQMSEVAAWTGQFIAECYNDLRKAYKNNGK